jgi:uncharacterized protein DUF3303
MLFMVIERFKQGESKPIGERFRSLGRMLPEGVVYRESWVDPAGMRCFQIMEAAHPGLLATWVSRWDDLVDFEIIPVLTSSEFWAKARTDERG